MQEKHVIQNNNDNFAKITQFTAAQETAQKQCWRMLAEVSQVVNLGFADLVEVRGENAGAHIALLARQFPTLGFEAGKVTNCGSALRVLWAIGENCLDELSFSARQCDIIVVAHEAPAVAKVQSVFEGFARIAAKRNIGDNCAISIFGKGLSRDIFKPKVRGQLAA